MTASWRWFGAAIIVLVVICSSFARELQSGNQQNLERAVHSQHGGARARGRHRDQASGGVNGHSLTRDERKRMREERRMSRLERREERRQQKLNNRRSGHENRNERPVEVVDLAWLRANLSSLWGEFRAFTKQHNIQAQGHTDHGSIQTGHGAHFGEPEVTDDASCPTGVDSCRNNEGRICSGHGDCSCGHCQCDPAYYGSTCQCSDHTCQSYDGMPCGGPSRGQCRCGGCVCRPGYVGEDCSCPTNTQTCIVPGDDTICSNKGSCKCGRCHCSDGYKGMYCEETVYAAGVCEKLKSCVLCKAWKRELSTCDQCQITVTVVNNLRPTRTTCVMVNSGCILKYSYIPEAANAYTVHVERNSECPPQID